MCGPLKAFLAGLHNNTKKLQGLAWKIENPIILPKTYRPSRAAAVVSSSPTPSLSARAPSPARAVHHRHQGQSFLSSTPQSDIVVPNRRAPPRLLGAPRPIRSRDRSVLPATFDRPVGCVPQMNKERLMKMAGAVRTGGKGTMRR